MRVCVRRKYLQPKKQVKYKSLKTKHGIERIPNSSWCKQTQWSERLPILTYIANIAIVFIRSWKLKEPVLFKHLHDSTSSLFNSSQINDQPKETTCVEGFRVRTRLTSLAIWSKATTHQHDTTTQFTICIHITTLLDILEQDHLVDKEPWITLPAGVPCRWWSTKSKQSWRGK